MNIRLEKTCTVCDGITYIKRGSRTISCEACNGIGRVLTDNGKQLLDILKFWNPFEHQLDSLSRRISELENTVYKIDDD